MIRPKVAKAPQVSGHVDKKTGLTLETRLSSSRPRYGDDRHELRIRFSTSLEIWNLLGR